MGSIYANAELTLFAVTGSDPSCGLAGVGVQRRPLIDDIVVGSVHFRHDGRHSLEEIECSKWATRGWTMQESYLSRRRLFFTERQMVFACNTEIICEHELGRSQPDRCLLDGMLGPGPRKEVAETEAPEKLLEAYSRREVRYEGDALNAISGILSLLTRPGSRYAHHFGILFDRPHRPLRYLRIQWKSNVPGYRRQSLPSWSPLGWSAHVKFTVPLYERVEGSIKMWTGHTWSAWSALTPDEIEDLRSDPPSDSRFLRVTALTFRLSVSSDTSGKPLKPYWDGVMSESEREKSVLCAALNQAPSSLLLLKLSDARPDRFTMNPLNLPVYDRVGTIVLEDTCQQLQDWISMNYRLEVDGFQSICVQEFEGRMETFMLA